MSNKNNNFGKLDDGTIVPKNDGIERGHTTDIEIFRGRKHEIALNKEKSRQKEKIEELEKEVAKNNWTLFLNMLRRWTGDNRNKRKRTLWQRFVKFVCFWRTETLGVELETIFPGASRKEVERTIKEKNQKLTDNIEKQRGW